MPTPGFDLNELNAACKAHAGAQARIGGLRTPRRGLHLDRFRSSL